VTNPYSDAADYQFWRRGAASKPSHALDYVVNPKFRINAATPVATAGSCFAQNISRKLRSIGFNYFVPEHGEALSPEERTARQFGVFSARYGNLYTVRQLLQLFDEAFSGEVRAEPWRRSDGRWVDACRPRVEPDGYQDREAVRAARDDHLAFVRDVFSGCDLFIFTLGLTEAWRSKRDGRVYPLAPGVAGGIFAAEWHEFVNFNVAETIADLESFLDRLKSLNSGVKVLLTVSPVPLAATYENRHVVVSTTYSKSVLRVAAQHAADTRDWVDYFPSYEIITASPTGGLYFETDWREINRMGVAHAMRCFSRNYLEDSANAAGTEPVLAEENAPFGKIVCDEEELAAIR
jgi:hypothetical protein